MNGVWPTLLPWFRTLPIPGLEIAVSQGDGQEGNSPMRLPSEMTSAGAAKLQAQETE